MYGLALEGGGAKGAYQIGAYKAMLEKGYHFDCVVGTSIGCINAALICQGGYELLEDLWNNVDSSLFGFSPNAVTKIVNREEGFRKTRRKLIKKVVKDKGIDLKKLRKLLEKYVDEDKIRKSSIKFGLVTVRLKGYVPMEVTIDEIPEGQLIDYMIASCSLPVFKLEPMIDDNIYIDGGYYNVLPLTLLERMGCTNIIGIRVKKFGLIKRIRNKKVKVKIIKPSKNIGPIVLFEPSEIKKNIELGYKETMEQL